MLRTDSSRGSALIRTMFSTMLGMLVATMVALGLEFVGKRVFPLPAGSLAADAAPADLIAAAPIGMLLFVVAGRLCGALCGAWVASRLASRHSMTAAMTVGALVLLSCVLDAWMLPQPLWMLLMGVVAPLPLAWCGGQLACRGSAPTP